LGARHFSSKEQIRRLRMLNKCRVWDKRDKVMRYMPEPGTKEEDIKDGQVAISFGDLLLGTTDAARVWIYGHDEETGELNMTSLPDTLFELMWSTGLPDKNGKEICEGDVATFDFIDYERSEKITEPIRWSEQGCSFVPWNWAYQCDGCDCHNSIENIEVIGNIRENPELIAPENG
jgi:hypothetical protein